MGWFSKKRKKENVIEGWVSVLDEAIKRNDTIIQMFELRIKIDRSSFMLYNEYLRLSLELGQCLVDSKTELGVLLVDESSSEAQEMIEKIESEFGVLDRFIGKESKYDLEEALRSAKRVETLIKELERL